ncbi:MAG TPA: DUF4340 domain-containing protein [Planctomycetota bacterium]|nr:DUF4340 domain-containing protein [Planctomycetota bacterium]
MNWKSTVVLAVLAAAAFAAYFLVQPPVETNAIRPRPFEWRESIFQTIAIKVPDQPDKVLRRQPAPALGSVWHLEEPAKPVDDALVADMIAALNRLTRDRSIKPGDAEYSPSNLGFDKPVATIDVTGRTEQRTIKLGNVSSKLPDTRFYMVEGEPEIYYAPANVAPPFQRTVSELRSRVFLSYDKQRVVGVEVARRYLKAGTPEKPDMTPELEKLKFTFRDKPVGGMVAGWYLASINGAPRDEKAEDVALGHLISGLADLRAEEYVPLADAPDFGFSDPEIVARLDILQPPSNATKAVLVEIGKTVDRGARKLTAVRVEGGDEAVLVNPAYVDRIPRERKHFIPPTLIDFDPAALEVIEMATDTGHRVKLTKKEVEQKRDGQAYKTIEWIVEPRSIPADPTAVTDFITWLLRVTISDVMGEQPDLATWGLDKPGLTLTLGIRPKSGVPSDRVYKIGRPPTAAPGEGYLLKPGSTEVFKISEDIWRRFDRADLNFRKLEMFSIPPQAIVGMSFVYRPDHLSANTVKYSVKKGAGGKWEFDDPDLKAQGAPLDAERMDYLVGQLNYVKAEGFLTRNPRVAREYKLDDREPQGRLAIRYADPDNPGKSTEKVFRFSKSFLDPSGQLRVYYAKIEAPPGDDSPSSDATIVFRIATKFVEDLRRGVVYEAKAAPDTEQDKKEKKD